MSDVAIIILAAGMSRRLGRPKQVLPLGGEPIVAHVGRRARQSTARRVMAVVGGAREETMAALEDIVDEIIVNNDFAGGQGTSIAAGIRYLDSTSHLLGACEAVVFLLADQPGIDPATIDAVIDTWREGAPIVMTQYRDQMSHPVLFDRTYWPELSRLAGEQGGKAVIDRHREDVAKVIVDADAPRDVDTEADWRVLQEWWATVSEDR